MTEALTKDQKEARAAEAELLKRPTPLTPEQEAMVAERIDGAKRAMLGRCQRAVLRAVARALTYIPEVRTPPRSRSVRRRGR